MQVSRPGCGSGQRRARGARLALALGSLAWIWSWPVVAAPPAGKAFKDWVIACEQREDGETGQCYMAQNVALRESGERLVHVAVGYSARGGDRPAALLTVPLGVFLPAGVALTIDGGEPRRMPLEYCIAAGCRALLPLDPSTESELKAGRQAQVIFQDLTRREIAVPVSLLGFTAGLRALRE